MTDIDIPIGDVFVRISKEPEAELIFTNDKGINIQSLEPHKMSVAEKTAKIRIKEALKVHGCSVLPRQVFNRYS